MIKKIAIIGGTGLLGNPVVSQLVRSGFEVTALARNLSRAQSSLPGAVTRIQGSLENSADLEKLFSGQDALYLNLNLNPTFRKNDFHPEREGLDLIIAGARKANLKRISIISSVVKNYQGMNNFHWWAFDIKQGAVDKIKNSGIPYTIFYPSTFMENFRGNYRQGNRIFLAGKSEHKMYFIAGEDYGNQVAASFKISTDQNKEYVVQGLEAFTADEAAKEYVTHYTATKLSISKAPLGLLKLLGLFNPKINYGAHIVEALNRYPEKFEAEDTWKELGKPSILLREYAKQP